ncbi:hypothetical protein ACFVP7_06815 [Bacillus sp. SG20033]|uniref:hypothetical protein n=1 Tax=Bacillus sp. SG20033 TaxID=3366583 RepID=UPI0037C60D37
MAEYKTLPNYEFMRDGLYLVFNGYGVYKTNVEKEIKALDAASPFIQRVDVEPLPIKEDKEEEVVTEEVAEDSPTPKEGKQKPKGPSKKKK